MSTKLTSLPERYEPGFLASLDRRTDLYKTLSTNYEEVVANLGGKNDLTHIMLSLIERFVFMEAVLQHLENLIVTNPKKTILVNRWIQGVNSLQGLACRIGLEKRINNNPTLKAYLAEA
jgi:hypothetical protein